MLFSEPESTATAPHRTSVICAFVELVKIYSESYPGRLYISQKKKREKERSRRAQQTI